METLSGGEYGDHRLSRLSHFSQRGKFGSLDVVQVRRVAKKDSNEMPLPDPYDIQTAEFPSSKNGAESC